MGQLARFAKPIIDEEAPDPASLNPRELLRLLGLGKRFRALGDDLAALQYKLTTMSAVDFLREWFESDELMSPMSVSGIIGTFLGVKSPGTAYVLLHHYMGDVDGNVVGPKVGNFDGLRVGAHEGEAEGAELGEVLGRAVGLALGHVLGL